MMKTKYLLAAMSLPLAFAACSDEFDELNSNMPMNKEGIKVTLNLSKDELGSRATWKDKTLGWESTDMISMYWGENFTSGNFTGKNNAIFKTTDGTAFNSESLVNLGHNAVVYPADLKHYTSTAVVIPVDTIQDAKTVTKTPHISNLLNIQAEEIDANTPGYHQAIYAPMKLAANVVTLKLKMKNTEALDKYGFKVESVDLIAEDDAFAKNAHLVLGDDANFNSDSLKTKGIYIRDCVEGCAETGAPHAQDSIQTIIKSLWVSASEKTNKLSSTAVDKDDKGNYIVTFVVLPTDRIYSDTDSATIVVNTSCGMIVIPNDAEENLVIKETAEPVSTDTVTIAEAINFFASSIKMTDKTSKFYGEKVGRTIPRTIEVDAANTVLNGCKVKDFEEVKRYVNLYKDMKKKDAMNLVMYNEGVTEAAVWGMPADVVKMIDEVNSAKDTKNMITLTADNKSVKAIQLTTVGAVYDFKAYNGSGIPAYLAEGEWTMDDTLAINTKFTKLENYGTLTIAGTAKENVQNVLVAKLKNEGTMKIAGNDKLFLNEQYELGGRSTFEVAKNQDLRFAQNIVAGHDFQGTIKVAADGFLTVADGVEVHSLANIENAGTIGSVGTTGGFYNEGKITVTDAMATTLIKDNSKGTIKMKSRTDAIKVESENQGKIVYTYTTGDDANFAKTATDKFTTVEFGSDIKTINLTYDKADIAAIENVSFEFNGEGAVILNADETKKVKIADLTVGKNAHLKINPDNAVYVDYIVNNGKVTAAGNIYYHNGYTANGEVISTGGSITEVGTMTVQNEITSQLKAALASDATAGTAANPVAIKLDKGLEGLTNGIVFDGSTTYSRTASTTEKDSVYVTLDLNGQTLQNTTDIYNLTTKVWSLISVKGKYVVTIKGNGKVLAKKNDCYAVDVRDGAKVIIEDGEFVGNISAIYTISGGSAEIKGGKYNIQQVHDKKGYSYLLNNNDKNTSKIKVTGGSFYKFNPASNDADPSAPVNFVPEGYTSTENAAGWFTVSPTTAAK